MISVIDNTSTLRHAWIMRAADTRFGKETLDNFEILSGNSHGRGFVDVQVCLQYFA